MRSVALHSLLPGKRQRGLSLVELLVSLALGLFIISFTIQIFFSSKQTYTALEGNSTLQNSARFGMDFIGSGLHMAGYRVGLGLDAEEKAFPAAGVFAQSQVIAAVDGAAGSTDVLHVRYQGNSDGLVKDCHGNTIAETQLVTLSYSVSAKGELICTVDGTKSEVVVDGVDDFQVLLGVDGGSDSVNKYVSAKAMSADDWKKVLAVKVGLLVSSDKDVSGVAEQQSFQLLASGNKSFDDRRMRREFIETFNLRNLAP